MEGEGTMGIRGGERNGDKRTEGKNPNISSSPLDMGVIRDMLNCHPNHILIIGIMII